MSDDPREIGDEVVGLWVLLVGTVAGIAFCWWALFGLGML